MALTFSEKQSLISQTAWSSAIVDAIGSLSEANIYIKAGLVEASVGGRPALVRTDIDWSAFNCRKEWLKEVMPNYEAYKDYNNADLIGEGYPPRDSNGDPYELHHIGQHQDSPFAELSWEEHRGVGNSAILHQYGIESEIDRGLFANEKSDYWQARFKLFSQKELNAIYNI